MRFDPLQHETAKPRNRETTKPRNRENSFVERTKTFSCVSWFRVFVRSWFDGALPRERASFRELGPVPVREMPD